MNVKRAWVDTESGVVLIFESLDQSLTRTQARAQLAALA